MSSAIILEKIPFSIVDTTMDNESELNANLTRQHLEFLKLWSNDVESPSIPPFEGPTMGNLIDHLDFQPPHVTPTWNNNNPFVPFGNEPILEFSPRLSRSSSPIPLHVDIPPHWDGRFSSHHQQAEKLLLMPTQPWIPEIAHQPIAFDSISRPSYAMTRSLSTRETEWFEDNAVYTSAITRNGLLYSEQPVQPNTVYEQPPALLPYQNVFTATNKAKQIWPVKNAYHIEKEFSNVMTNRRPLAVFHREISDWDRITDKIRFCLRAMEKMASNRECATKTTRPVFQLEIPNKDFKLQTHWNQLQNTIKAEYRLSFLHVWNLADACKRKRIDAAASTKMIFQRFDEAIDDFELTRKFSILQVNINGVLADQNEVNELIASIDNVASSVMDVNNQAWALQTRLELHDQHSTMMPIASPAAVVRLPPPNESRSPTVHNRRAGS